MNQSGPFNRVLLVVLDSVGIGEMPDAADYGDAGSDTLGHTLGSREVTIPNLRRMGLATFGGCRFNPPRLRKGHLARPQPSLAARTRPPVIGDGGIITSNPFPTYPDGFPRRVLDPFEKAIARPVLGNKAASGTEIIKELGDEHVRTGRPIVYTSADSVFQIAAHEQIVPLDQLYGWCKIARELLTGQDTVGRVIARPFAGESGNFKRTEARQDYAIDPPEDTLLDRMKAAGLAVTGVGRSARYFVTGALQKNSPREITTQA